MLLLLLLLLRLLLLMLTPLHTDCSVLLDLGLCLNKNMAAIG